MPTENRSSNTEMVSVPREHELKIRQTPLTDLLSGLKTGEVRDCSDREFAPGDTVLLREVDDAREYTGRTARRTITHVQKHFGLPDNLCVLSYGQPAEQHQGEPVATMYVALREDFNDFVCLGRPGSGGNLYKTVPLYTRADPGEIERAESETMAAIAELAECEAMAAMVAEREWAEHVGTGDVSSKVEAAFTQLHNELHEAGEKLAELDALLREAIPMLLDGAPGNPDIPLQKLRDLLSASAEPSAPVEHDHDALVAAVCVLRSQGLGNLSEAVEAARAALERKPQVKS